MPLVVEDRTVERETVGCQEGSWAFGRMMQSGTRETRTETEIAGEGRGPTKRRRRRCQLFWRPPCARGDWKEHVSSPCQLAPRATFSWRVFFFGGEPVGVTHASNRRRNHSYPSHTWAALLLCPPPSLPATPAAAPAADPSRAVDDDDESRLPPPPPPAGACAATTRVTRPDAVAWATSASDTSSPPPPFSAPCPDRFRPAPALRGGLS